MESKTQEVVVLRCYAFRRFRDHRVYAECIDLDIIVVRDSIEEAIDALNDAVIGHVEAAAEQGWLETLVPRPSPLGKRLRYHLFVALFTLRVIFRECTRVIRPFQMEYSRDQDHRPVFQHPACAS
jgi:hypothetical protein